MVEGNSTKVYVFTIIESIKVNVIEMYKQIFVRLNHQLKHIWG